MISVFFIYWKYAWCMDDAFANRETSGNPDIILKTHKKSRGRMLPFPSTGERSVAAADGDAGRKVTGADSSFRRTACIHPRPRVSARIRFAVRSLSEVTDRGNTLRKGERGCGSPHPPRSGPPSPQGEGLNAAERERDCLYCGERSVAAQPDRGRMLPFTSAGERSVAVGGADAGRRVTGADSSFRRTACIHPRPREAQGSGLR